MSLIFVSASADVALSEAAHEHKHGTWQPRAMVTAEARAAGVTVGGEGAQWPQSIDIDPVTGEFLVFSTDVGGLWRSIDGGATWEPANVGYTPRGGCGIAIDPNFPERVISVGSNSMGSAENGLYLSEDRAASWRAVMKVPMSGREDRRRQVAFDPTTGDDDAGLTRVAYWSRGREVQPDIWGELEIDPGLYRSDDGGRHWTRLDGAADAAGHAALAVHPTTGRLYAASERGVYVSDDRGSTFHRVLDTPATSIGVSPDRPNAVWVTHPDGLSSSSDAGESWSAIETTGLEEPIAGETGRDAAPTPRRNVVFGALRVSPADADRMVMRSLADDWRWLRHVSHDGGRTWRLGEVDSSLAFFPLNARQLMFDWHPTDPDVVWSFGGDWPTRSDDGGQTFEWAGNGQNAVFVAGHFNFNPHHPGLLFLSSQDYNGGVTHDGGETWRYTPVSGEGWGGFVYGGLAISPTVLVGGHARGGWGAERVLSISRDGGASWSESPDVSWTSDRGDPTYGVDVGLVDPIDPDRAFIAGFRTTDGGATWSRMDGVDGVYAASRSSSRLFGVEADAARSRLVVSDDHGQTWKELIQIDGSIDDVSVTPDGSTVYLASQSRLWRYRVDGDRERVLGNPLVLIDTPPTSTGRHRIDSVAVDPRHPSTVFAGQRIDLHAADVGVMRSDDGGATWHNLNASAPLGPGEIVDGGREPQCIRVDPHTGDLWATTGCYGVWVYRQAN
ncbi:MAG: hypothetical protein AAFY08_00150 [Planctomycetota bacterium]